MIFCSVSHLQIDLNYRSESFLRCQRPLSEIGLNLFKIEFLPLTMDLTVK